MYDKYWVKHDEPDIFPQLNLSATLQMLRTTVTVHAEVYVIFFENNNSISTPTSRATYQFRVETCFTKRFLVRTRIHYIETTCYTHCLIKLYQNLPVYKLRTVPLCGERARARTHAHKVLKPSSNVTLFTRLLPSTC